MSGRLRDLCSEDLPREKLLRLGRGKLSNAELLAIFLRMGVPGKNVIQLSLELIAKAGSLEALARLDAEEIKGLCKGIGTAKAVTLAAVFELGGRAIKEEVSRRSLDKPEYVYDLIVTETRWLSQEMAYVLLVDASLNLIRKVDVSIGSLTEAIIHPRDVLKPAIVSNAYGFILAHNHPSGSVKPSKADDKTTSRLKEAASIVGIRFVDHVIVGKPGGYGEALFFSYKAEGLLK